MIINHNMSSMNAHRQMIGNTSNAGKSMEKLSSGLRINRAGDDAAGLAISEKMRGQIRGLDQATRNSQDGISLIQTAEGALNETHSILQRMRELAVQASNDTNNTSDRGQIQKEMNQLTSEINRIGNTTEFNTMKLLNGEKSASHITGSSVDSRTFIKNGVEQVFTSVGVTNGASSLNLASTITFGAGAGNGFSWNDLSAASATSTLTISKNASGQLEVVIHAEASGGTQVLSATHRQNVSWDANNQYTFNGDGISFTINKTDFDDASNNTKVVDLFVANGAPAAGSNDLSGIALSTQDSWVSNGAMAAITGSGVTLTGSQMGSGVASAAATLQISIASGAAGSGIGNITVTITNAAGSALFVDTVSAIHNSAVAYNNMGISFNLSAVASQLSATYTLDLTANGYKGTSQVTLYDSKDDSLTFQVGANIAQSMSVAIDDMRSNALKITSTTAGAGFTASQVVTDGTNNTNVEYALDVTSASNATKNITVIQDAMDKVSDARAKLGAYQNRLEHTIANLGTSSENLQAAESRIRDVDMAKEMSTFSKNNILAQAAQAMLAQANQQPQQVLQLLR